MRPASGTPEDPAANARAAATRISRNEAGVWDAGGLPPDRPSYTRSP